MEEIGQLKQAIDTNDIMATWMLEHGSDVHQGGAGPLMRAALNGYRIPMTELLVTG